jgi:hypothetical protein
MYCGTGSGARSFLRMAQDISGGGFMRLLVVGNYCG